MIDDLDGDEHLRAPLEFVEDITAVPKKFHYADRQFF
jgi:hypothetical protein